MTELERLPNLGRVNARKLQEVGVDTPERLREVGAEEAFLRLRRNDPGACLHLLTALEGAVEGIRKADLPPERKEQLKAFFHAVQNGEYD